MRLISTYWPTFSSFSSRRSGRSVSFAQYFAIVASPEASPFAKSRNISGAVRSSFMSSSAPERKCNATFLRL